MKASTLAKVVIALWGKADKPDVSLPGDSQLLGRNPQFEEALQMREILNAYRLGRGLKKDAAL